MSDKYQELREEFVPVTRTIEQNKFSLTNEYVNIADFVSLEQRYNLLLDYVKEKTGSSDEEIKRFVCDKWQRANSYWCRSSLDYAFASEEDIQESYKFDMPDNEKMDLFEKLRSVKAEYLDKYKLSIWYNEQKNDQKTSTKNVSNDRQPSTANTKENTDVLNELKKSKKNVIDLMAVAEYYKDRYLNAKSIIDYLLNNKIISKQVMAQCKPKKLAEEIESKIKSIPKFFLEKWGIKT